MFANRIEEIKQDLLSSNDPEDLMLMIMDAINDTVTPIPEVGKFYTFVYNAKTPGKQYDQHPLIACTALEKWGFKGFNYHWNATRNYTWMNLQVNFILLNGMNSMTFLQFLMQNTY